MTLIRPYQPADEAPLFELAPFARPRHLMTKLLAQRCAQTWPMRHRYLKKYLA